ncbi:hypothetical protein ACDQ55_11970 [Chitinophaga sp. 30R24]|uniref:hypothetical protein n=1 Tax=Chitinophaga sp. 30R24 TaxID=3248838 RepID=UPI003B8F8F02
MSIRNIVFILLMLTGVGVVAQQPVANDVRLKGEWQIRRVSMEVYHMQQGNLLQTKEITSADSIAAINGMVFLNMVFSDDDCLIKRRYSREGWHYTQMDAGLLELKQTPLNPAKQQEEGPVLRWYYSFDKNGQLSAGPLVAGYTDLATGTPVKIKYICHYTRIN